MKQKTGAGRVKESAEPMILRIITEIYARPGLKLFAECLFRGIMGFIISQAVIFDEYSPFGFGFAAVAGGTVQGLAGAIGAILGYANLWRLADSLKYISGSILIVAANFVFRETSMLQRRFFAPVVASVSAFCVGFVFVAAGGFAFRDTLLFFTEIVLVFASAYFYNGYFAGTRGVDREENARREVALLCIIGTLLMSMSRLSIIAGMSLGRFLAVLLVMVSAYRGGMSGGCMSGVAAGIAVGISSDGAGGFYAMCYGISGLTAGVCGAKGRLPLAIAFVLTNAAAVLLGSGDNLNTSALYETFAASVIFAILPKRWMYELDIFPEVVASPGDRLGRYVRERIDGLAGAFRELSISVRAAGQRPVRNTEDISVVFERAANKVCRKCAFRGLCWDRDGVNTYNVMNDAARAIKAKGKLSTGDMPAYFISRCLKLEAFVGAVNDEVRIFRHLEGYRSRLKSNREQICSQYTGIEEMLKSFSEELSEGLTEDIYAERKLARIMKVKNLPGRAVAWRNSKNQLNVEIEAEELESADSLAAELGEALGTEFSESERQLCAQGERILLKESAPMVSKLGTAAKKRRESEQSGDCGTYFNTLDGDVYIILSDGMGSGREAASESGFVVRLMEKMLRAGISPQNAIPAVSAAVKLRNEDECGFATVDVIRIDLFRGKADSFKCGAAPTYIKQGKKVERLIGKTLPLGLGKGEVQPDSSSFRLKDGMMLIAVTDGVCDGSDDSWLVEMISEYDGEEIKSFAEKIVTAADRRSGGADDMTAAVIRISE